MLLDPKELTKMTKSILEKANLFLKLAKEELPADSKNINIILKNLSKLTTFSARIEYAERNLKHFSSGSSRVIYLLPNKREVLKLAKNESGLEQNKSESKVKAKHINKTLKSDKNGVWKISPLAKKITEKQFEKLTGVNFKDFGKCIEYALKNISKDKTKKPKCFDDICENDVFKDLVSAGKKYKLMPGDLARISSYGEIDKVPVVLDAGFNREVYESFYE